MFNFLIKKISTNLAKRMSVNSEFCCNTPILILVYNSTLSKHQRLLKSHESSKEREKCG